jgi:Ca-activated chloride channel family protein
MRPLIRAGLLSLTTLAGGARLSAQGWIVPRPCGIGIMPVEERPVPLPIRDCRPNIVRTRSDVHVELTDRVLHYEVEERFVNRGAMIGEADYLFPLPGNAAFQDLKLSINGELVSGETMNAGDARRIYENIVRAQRDPALVEWMGHGLLRARIFPLNPGEEKRIVVRFQSVAPREGDALRIDYFRGPNTNPSTVHDGGSSSFVLDYRALPEFGAPFSPTHAVDVSEHDGRRQVTVRGDARDVTLLVPVRRNAAAAISALAYAPGNEDAFALVTVSPPMTSRAETTPRDVTLVLDVSGSMQGRKMEQARAAGKQLLATLRPDDRFRLIDFSSDVRTFRDEFVAATAANVREANRYLDALEAQGGTNIEGALREAIRPSITSERLPLVLFVTDGEPTIGDRSPDRLAAIAATGTTSADSHRRIFTFGLGSDVNVSLLEQLALEGRGTAQFVRPDESVERMVGIVANRLVDPVLTDVRVRVDGDVRLDRRLPAQPTDIFADRDFVLLARYTGHGTARVVVDGKRRGTPVQWTSTIDFPERDRQNPFVARLWATQRVGLLSAERRKNGGSREIDDEIRSLGERYGIPTEFTSYLVTEPQLTARVGMMRNGASGQPGAQLSGATGAADQRFESAKAASAQRSVTSVMALDSIARAASPPANSPTLAAERVSTQRVNGRTFVLRDSVWTDTRYQATMATTTLKPFSQAYFDLLDRLPELRAVFALGARVIVVGKDRAISLSERGAAQLGPAELKAIVSTW